MLLNRYKYMKLSLICSNITSVNSPDFNTDYIQYDPQSLKQAAKNTFAWSAEMLVNLYS